MCINLSKVKFRDGPETVYDAEHGAARSVEHFGLVDVKFLRQSKPHHAVSAHPFRRVRPKRNLSLLSFSLLPLSSVLLFSVVTQISRSNPLATLRPPTKDDPTGAWADRNPVGTTRINRGEVVESLDCKHSGPK